jgi:anti-sigma factor RsiW
MKCSACEARLPAYLDNDCAPREAEALAQHLTSCADCRAQAERLRAVELRLARVRGIEPRADFTHAVMARVAVMPAPVARRAPLWLLFLYVPAAWAVLFALTALRIIDWQRVTAGLSVFSGKLGVAAETLYHVVQHFHLTAYALSGATLEIALLALAVAVARIYLLNMPSWGLGARVR